MDEIIQLYMEIAGKIIHFLYFTPIKIYRMLPDSAINTILGIMCVISILMIIHAVKNRHKILECVT